MTDTIQYYGAYAALGVDSRMRLDNFRENFKVEMNTEEIIKVDMIGIDIKLANAFRRILIDEVPTMATERVYIAKNTSHTEDRILVHELETILIIADPRLFEYSYTIQYFGAYATLGVDSRMRLDNFRENFKVEVNKLTEEIIEIDMIGIDIKLANAFRRILIDEVPTMAIERVYITKNTSHTEDRILVHELENILIIADPRLFEYSENAGDEKNEKNTLVFKLHLECPSEVGRLNEFGWSLK
ncbi:hypothetical protein Lal_00021730 [Lupinus albus]|nr:hypothetical protein Lal_00021730 [Lupinus albus]